MRISDCSSCVCSSDLVPGLVIELDRDVGEPGVLIALAEQLDELSAAGEWVGAAGGDQEGEVVAHRGRVGNACGGAEDRWHGGVGEVDATQRIGDQEVDLGLVAGEHRSEERIGGKVCGSMRGARWL